MTVAPYCPVAGKLLASPEAYVRNAALAIMQMLGEVAVPTLAELIIHQDRDSRKLATDALNKITGDAACSLLIGGLGDNDPNIIITCAESLGNRRDVQIMPAFFADKVKKHSTNEMIAAIRIASCNCPNLLADE